MQLGIAHYSATMPAIVVFSPFKTHILFFSLLLCLCTLQSGFSALLLPYQHPDPESVVQDVHRLVNVSLSRRQMLESSSSVEHLSSSSSSSGCLTGNPIDDCWRCDPNWASNRQRLADCGIGFGRSATGGKGGQIYVVTDSSDPDPVNPRPGTLRYAVLKEEPLWIVFASDMTIKLRYELIVNSHKTIDGRGAKVHITGGGCITLQYVSNVIIHNIHIDHCVPAGNAIIRSSPTHVGYRTKSDGDGITIFGASNIWVDHCTLSSCTDGLIDATMGSTGITISNCHFSHHNDVMLLGNSDGYILDAGMQVTLAFNVFGEGLVQRMPRCRRGYIHVVNNDFRYWEIYVIGGSANPTINSQGNRYIAPNNPNTKEVTKRVETDDKDWADWNWRTEGDIMVNGAFFVPSGQGLSAEYAKAWSIEPKSAQQIDHLTLNAGVFGDPRDSISVGYGAGTSTTSSSGRGGGSGSDGDGDLFGMIFGGGGSGSGSGRGGAASLALSTPSFMVILVTISVIYTITNTNDLFSLTFSSSN